MKREYRVILCPQCAEGCGVWIENDHTDPGYREGVGENFEHDSVWYCSDKCLAEAITEEAESEGDEDYE